MTTFVHAWESIILVYFLAYNAINFFLLTFAWLRVRYFLQLRSFLNTDEVASSPSLPAVTLLVPAHNEEKTIVDNIRSLMNLRYPKLEIVIVNDGSTDRTFEELKEAFGFLRQEIGYSPRIPTATVRAFYVAPPIMSDTGPRHIALINKEQGGKADALNCALNAATSPYVCSMDADSIINRDTLLEIMHPMLRSPAEFFGCGGQVGIANGLTIKDGVVTAVALPKNHLAMFQVVEYMRSFTAGRTSLAALDSLVILSGVFAVFKRDLVISVGGFLTKKLTSRIAQEYGGGRETVCEDMEIVVRLYRYVKEKKINLKLLFLPHPITWSQAPGTIRDFGRQRNRWYRGLAQVLLIHKRMLFNPGYGAIGVFGLPYQLVFEFLGPLLELAGYISLPIFFYFGLLKWPTFLLFIILSLACGALFSIYAVLIGLWSEPDAVIQRQGKEGATLFQYQGFSNAMKLMVYAGLSMFGYRQLQLVYQWQGFLDFLRGRQEWQKVTRQEFSPTDTEWIPRGSRLDF